LIVFRDEDEELEARRCGVISIVGSVTSTGPTFTPFTSTKTVLKIGGSSK